MIWPTAFLRALALVYAIAFVSLGVQLEGLVGREGILPAEELLARVREAAPGLDRYRDVPSLYWLAPTDSGLAVIWIAGALLSAFGVLLLAPAWIYAALYGLYLSLYAIGGDFLGFQWDVLLLETGFLAIFVAPLAALPRRASAPDPSLIVRVLLWWLLFRLMFASGAAKLLSGDESWWGLTALTVHYETQPLPTWIGWWAHQLPAGVHRLACAFMLAIELAVPFLVFCGRRARVAAAVPFLLLQITIAATGNYGFFNLLTVVLLLPLLDVESERRGAHPPGGRAWPRTVVLPLAGLLLLLSTATFLSGLGVGRDLVAPLDPVRRLVAPLSLTSRYGLFAVMTKTRPEIVVEGSDDGETWKAYRFSWKPGTVDERPRFVAPHQPRLDWQMWFAALGDARRSPWFEAFARRLLEGSSAVVDLLEENPFRDAPPRFVRATLWRYRFTRVGADDNWWTREKIGLYLEPMQLPGALRGSPPRPVPSPSTSPQEGEVGNGISVGVEEEKPESHRDEQHARGAL